MVLVVEINVILYDYLSIVVEFENGKDLIYLWSWELFVGFSFFCLFEGWKDREIYIVVCFGMGDLGKWLNELYSILVDYDKVIGGLVLGWIVCIWLIVNSVFGCGEGCV